MSKEKKKEENEIFIKDIENKKRDKIEIKKIKSKEERAITLIALVITIVLNCSCLAMDRMNKIEKI